MEGEVTGRELRQRSQGMAPGSSDGDGEKSLFPILAIAFGAIAFVFGVAAIVARVLGVTDGILATISGFGLFAAIPGFIGLASGVLGFMKSQSKKALPLIGAVLGLLGLLCGVGCLFVAMPSAEPVEVSANVNDGKNTNSNSNENKSANDNDDDEGDDNGNANSNSDDADDNANSNSNGNDANQNGAQNTANSNQQQPQQPVAYTPGISDGTRYSNPFFGITLVPTPPYVLCQSSELLNLAGWRLGQLDPMNTGTVQAEAAAWNPEDGASAMIITGTPDKFTMTASQDPFVIASEQLALKQDILAAFDDRVIEERNIQIANIGLPCVMTSVPSANLYSVEAYGVLNGRVVLYTGTGNNMEEAISTLAMVIPQ